MALLPCRECNQTVSTEALSCPHCGTVNPGGTNPLPPSSPKKASKKGHPIIAAVLGLGSLFAIAMALGSVEQDRKHASFTPSQSDCAADWRRCANNVEMRDIFPGWARVKSECRDNAKKRAQYGTPEFPWSAFGTTLSGSDFSKTGIVTAIETDAQFSNGFGAMVHSRVTCQYDLNRNEVLSIAIAPNR